MKKLTVFLFTLFFSLGMSLPVWAEPDMNSNPTPEKKVELTAKQKKELEKLHKDMLNKKKQLIDKHVEFGIMPKEKGDKIKAKLDKRFEMMKQNGFMPSCHGKSKHHDDANDDGADNNDDSRGTDNADANNESNSSTQAPVPTP